MPNHAVTGIDFAAIHFWPDNWGRTDLDFGKNWLSAHANMSSLLQKPLIVEEFGKAFGGAPSPPSSGPCSPPGPPPPPPGAPPLPEPPPPSTVAILLY
jgi:hypothetical protein